MMFRAFKLNFDVDVLAFFGATTISATFFQILGNFSNHLVTLKKRHLAIVWKK